MDSFTACTLSLVSLAKCSSSRARLNNIILKGKSRNEPHIIETPVFMPVGTQGTMKGITTDQMNKLGCKIFLGNTYHLGHRPGPEIMKKAGGLHKFMNWNGGLLTDSGGFQMVSLVKLSKVSEEGVHFISPHDDSEMLLTPEHSMYIQNALGADIMMQLDDVVSSLTTGPRVEEAMLRSVRWLDRCIESHKRTEDQALFAIIQGGLGLEMRKQCLDMMKERSHKVGGFAVGGLSGGEDKPSFWKAVDLCCRTDADGGLPENKPRYVMGVGYVLDILVCVALGADMFDCVYPTRIGRFGLALVKRGGQRGQINLNASQFRTDFTPIENDCVCIACKNHTRAYLNSISQTTQFSSLVSIHNVAFMLDFMSRIREAIRNDQFPEFCKYFFEDYFDSRDDYPDWAIDALRTVNIQI